MVGPATVCACGIAVSKDGVHWPRGVGGYGDGWGEGGQGIIVPIGSTVYIKYYGDGSALSLRYALHGTRWGAFWNGIGPALDSTIGNAGHNPVILKISHIGTEKSTVSWAKDNQTWKGPRNIGVYDLGLRSDAAWTLPPITITDDASSNRFRFLSWFRSTDDAGGLPHGGIAVPDEGSSLGLLALALIAVRAMSRHRSVFN